MLVQGSNGVAFERSVRGATVVGVFVKGRRKAVACQLGNC